MMDGLGKADPRTSGGGGGKKALDFTWESCAASLKLDAYPWDGSVPTDIMNRDF